MMPTRWQGPALVVLRTLVGWHFLYEGYYKLVLPAWSPAGAPLPVWSAGGYLRAATGPFAPLFHALAGSSLAGWIDWVVPVALVLVGLSLILGLFTRQGVAGAVVLLALFYVAAIPTDGVPRPGAEGTYLIVNKTLVELGAALVLLASRTEAIAGLDVLRRRGAVAQRKVSV
jgi:thiosulfate dehydrogenase [quinone] large subunit